MKEKLKVINIIKSVILILCITLSFYLIFENVTSKIKKEKEDKIVEKFIEENTNENDIEENTNKTNYNQGYISDRYNYTSVLEIPKIGLKKGLNSINSKYNNVKYNIKIIIGSDMPNVDNGNFILASHNGGSYKAFFKRLNELNKDDIVNVYYQGYKYEYKISFSYEIAKTGFANIQKNGNKTAITLITCKKNTRDTQIVYVGYLNSKVKY